MSQSTRGAMYAAAIFVGLWVVFWGLISIGQSAATGKPLLQCLLTSKADCGPTPHSRSGGGT